MLLVKILLVLILLVVAVIIVPVLKMRRGRFLAEGELARLDIPKLTNFGSVKNLSIMPLIEYFSDDPDYLTEEGVSYLIKADDTKILFDLGSNKKGEHPSPMIRNMNRAGIKPTDLSMIFISHGHYDHVGGAGAESRGEFTLSAGPVKTGRIPVFTPSDIKPAQNNPGLPVTVVSNPVVIGNGLASIGTYPRSLFLLGRTDEHSLAVNVKGKGIVLIIGCGHQKAEAIIERARRIFKEPIYGVIGGLHLPVKGGRVMKGPFNMQNIVGVDRWPILGIRGKDVDSAINMIKSLNPGIVALSPHDSSDWAIEQFKAAFGNRYRELKAGTEIKI